MNHDAGNHPRTTALLTAVSLTPAAAAMALRPNLSASDLACVFMHSRKPHIVDQRKTTIGGLQEKRKTPIQSRMASKDAQYFEIATRLTAIRSGLTDLNQKEFATKHGFNVTQWNNWESGTRRIPVESAEKLCHLYGLTLDFIYMGRRDGLAEKASKVL